MKQSQLIPYLFLFLFINQTFDKLTINREGLPAGVYFYWLETTAGQFGSGKIIIQ